jgi:hypothetical protein
MKQMKEQVGILNGIILNLVSLLNIQKVNIMDGIVIRGINPIQIQMKKNIMEKLENYLLHVLYLTHQNIRVEN